MPANNLPELKNFSIVATHPRLTIFSEHGETTTIYDPRNEADITKLCQAANLEEFIKDKEDIQYPHLLVFESGRYARGVVANEPIKKDQILCEYLGEIDSLEAVIDRDKVTQLLTQELLSSSLKAHDPASFDDLDKAIDAYIKHVSAYAFELTRKSGPDDCMLAHRKRSLAAFINHHTTDPNVHVDVIKHSIRFIASRDIAKGEQLRIDYGPDYEYEEYMSYIPSTENHLRRGKFLADNFQYYHPIPISLTKNQKIALGTELDDVFIPYFVLQLLNQEKVNHFSEYEKRLPIIEIFKFSKQSKKNIHYDIYVPEYQQNIMPLLFASALKNKKSVKKLIEDSTIDIFSKTVQDRDALIVMLMSIKSEELFFKLAKPLLQILAKNVKRIDYLGSDHNKNTALHIIVERGWHTLIKWFNHKTFFAVVDLNDYDPLMLAIARGQVSTLNALYKLDYVKKNIKKLLLIREELETCNEYILKRALKETPKKSFKKISGILLKIFKEDLKIKKIVQNIIASASGSTS
ncbi:MAG: SET domain-containing protein-lysine N-methyltransferase [Gammaproteobacteria bacterium]|nr:SET domain-containing protein-lysine N-methyltransferase [Gammaproteobacteria bacterium]